jgi:hypothetical protein
MPLTSATCRKDKVNKLELRVMVWHGSEQLLFLPWHENSHWPRLHSITPGPTKVSRAWHACVSISRSKLAVISIVPVAFIGYAYMLFCTFDSLCRYWRRSVMLRDFLVFSTWQYWRWCQENSNSSRSLSSLSTTETLRKPEWISITNDLMAQDVLIGRTRCNCQYLLLIAKTILNTIPLLDTYLY